MTQRGWTNMLRRASFRYWALTAIESRPRLPASTTQTSGPCSRSRFSRDAHRLAALLLMRPGSERGSLHARGFWRSRVAHPVPTRARFRDHAKATAGGADTTLLVGDGGAGRAGERHDIYLFEPGLFAPFSEVAACEIEGVAELDQHVERHE